MNSSKLRDKNIVRIKALLDKNVENGATEAEALAALTKATQLMKEHYISLADLKDPYVVAKCVLKEIPLIRSGYDLGLFYAELSRLFDCLHYYNSVRIAFFGFEEDVALCSYFYKLITETALQEKHEFLKSEAGLIAKQKNHGRAVAASFLKGFLIRVSQKLNELYKDKVSNLPQGTGLMVLDKNQKVQSQFNDLEISLRTRNQTKIEISAMHAFQIGCIKGEKFEITQGIYAHQNSKVILLK